MAALAQDSHMASTVSQVDDIITWEQFENAFERLSIKDNCESGGSWAPGPHDPAAKPQSEAQNGPQFYQIEDVTLAAKKPGLRGRAASMPPPTIRITPPPADAHEDESLSS